MIPLPMVVGWQADGDGGARGILRLGQEPEHMAGSFPAAATGSPGVILVGGDGDRITVRVAENTKLIWQPADSSPRVGCSSR